MLATTAPTITARRTARDFVKLTEAGLISTLETQEMRLSVEASSEAWECPGRADDTVARYDDGDRVSSVGCSDCAGLPRSRSSQRKKPGRHHRTVPPCHRLFRDTPRLRWRPRR